MIRALPKEKKVYKNFEADCDAHFQRIINETPMLAIGETGAVLGREFLKLAWEYGLSPEEVDLEFTKWAVAQVTDFG